MPVVKKSIRIEAPIEKVFGTVTDPDNWIRYVTSLVEISDRSPDLPAEGSTFSWKYKMMGFTFGGKGTVSLNSRNEAFGIVLESRFPIRESYEFADSGGSTDLSVTIDYEMPGPMKALFEGTTVIEKMNDIEAKGVLEKIRALCEAG